MNKPLIFIISLTLMLLAPSSVFSQSAFSDLQEELAPPTLAADVSDSVTDDVTIEEQDVDDVEEIQFERIPSKSVLIFSIDVAKEAIKTDRYAVAVAKLRELLDQMKMARQRSLSEFFPAAFGEFEQEKPSNVPGYFTQVVDDYGVILTKSYKGAEGQKVDVNLVYADPSIQDYRETINNTKLVKSLEGVRLVKVDNDYKGLLKFSEEDQTCEYNIVIGHDILVNVLAIGIDSPKDLKPLLKGVKFDSIKEFLE